MLTHLQQTAALAVTAVAMLITSPIGSADRKPIEERRTYGYGQVAFDAMGPEGWHWQAVQWKERYLKLRRQLLHRPAVTEAINLACATYGHCSTLWSKARCESRLYAYARNPSGASGLFQFLPSTFASTPYARFSIWSPYANALAAGWMHARGRGGEWVCR